MLNLSKTKRQKAIIFFITVIFILSNFYSLFMLAIPQAKAQKESAEAVPPVGVIVTDVPNKASRIITGILDELKAVFFKNILGTLLNTIAQQTATWIASGAKGQGPQWITNFDQFIEDYAKGAITDMVVNFIKDVTGINICTFDPRLTIDLALSIPMFPDYKGYTPSCTWQQLTDHWKEIGKGQFLTLNYTISEGGEFSQNTEKLKTQISVDETLQIWDKLLQPYLSLGTCSEMSPYKILGIDSVKIKCSEKSITQQDLENTVAGLSVITQDLASDADKMASAAQTTQSVQLSVGSYLILPENINQIKTAWLKKVDQYNWTSDLDPTVLFGPCQNKTREALISAGCEAWVNELGLSFPPPVSQSGNTGEVMIFENLVKEKVAYVVNTGTSIKSGFDYLKTQINEQFKPENFEGGAAYSAELARGLFNPEANQYNTYKTMYEAMTGEGLSAFFNRQLQATVNQGWKSVTEKISEFVNTPASLLHAKAVKDLTANDTAAVYTKSIIADAMGVFMQTLWNEFMRRLLESLANAMQEEESIAKLPALPELAELAELAGQKTEGQGPGTESNFYAQKIVSVEGVQSYIEKLAQQFTLNFSLKDLNLLSDFQLRITGEMKPNLYNNVIDSKFALAINDKQTIKQAIDKGRLIGTYTFSWGETEETGTYNLANIKKLRKARVVPLGLELAVELIRDCNFRKTYDENGDNQPDYANFEDITADNHEGYSNFSRPFVTQKLKNCLFKPFTEGEKTLEDIRNYNKNKLNQVMNATLADVVNGYDKIGTGICGDFDDQESPFCNLVNPNWVLKIPVTKCATQIEGEPYNEILQTNQMGIKYASCPDFASCLEEDGKGGCPAEQYGFCVKENNVWQFGVNTCPADFNSCRLYRQKKPEGMTAVAYLKNTLSGSEICGPQNAGCNWYLTKTGKNDIWKDFASLLDADTCKFAGGTWLANEMVCQAERIYLNRYAENCTSENEGCNEFFIYRDPANNLLADSSFEYTEENKFPADWDLLLQQAVGADKPLIDENACKSLNQKTDGCFRADNCGYIKTCLNYDYNDPVNGQSLCLANNGQWFVSGICTDNTSQTETDCQNNNAKWVHCLGAINMAADLNDCTNHSGQYKEYCLTSILKYNLCENPKLEQTECLANKGFWQSECQKGGQVVTELTNQTDCEYNKGSWIQYCQGAKLYGSNKKQCQSFLGIWRGEGPFTDLAEVSKNGLDTERGVAKLQIRTGDLNEGQGLRLIYKSKFSDNKVLTKAGDVYTATAYLKASQALSQPLILSLVGGENEINSSELYLNEDYLQYSSTLITANPGNDLEMRLNLPYVPGGIVYLDAAGLSINSLDQVRSLDFVQPFQDYELNNKVYYKKSNVSLNCHGYGSNDPPPVLDPLTYDSKAKCEAANGYWDQPASGVGVFIPNKTGVCYKYGPDYPTCKNFMKVCEPEEVGCQIFTPINGDPQIPGVVSLTDYCPAECVGYQTYKQDPTLYEPEPEPLFNNFIATTATSCFLDEVGCAQFTNLDEVARGGEGIEYYSYLRQCIKPNLGLGEKTFFTWQSSASGPPQVVKYEFQSDKTTGAPKTIDNSGDCGLTLGTEDFNCIKFFDSDGKEYYRDIRTTITVSEDCHPYRKTESTQKNCEATNGRWQADISACLYDAIPKEGIICRSETNGCRAYIGNRGNNIYVQLFDNFESSQPLDWYSGREGTNTGNLAKVGESVVVGGHSLYAPETTDSVHKFVDIQKGNLYTLSFWAKTASQTEDIIAVKFSTAPDNNAFATLESRKVKLNTNWQNFNLGPVYIDWDVTANNSLIFSDIGNKIYLDNITLKVVKDNVYVVKNSWITPTSCDQNFYGAPEEGAMLGCQAYLDTLNQTHNLKSFTGLCRSSAVGCQILVDTKNSINPNQQLFNRENATLLDDYEVPKDELFTFVLDNNFSCTKADKGCQKLGMPVYEETGALSFKDVYIKNDPDKYIDVPNAIMCNDEALGCTELINEAGAFEYYKIEPTKLCEFKQGLVNGQNVRGWFKRGNTVLGCGGLAYSQIDCTADKGAAWSVKYNQCSVILNDVKDEGICSERNGEWGWCNNGSSPNQQDCLSKGGTWHDDCLAYPFSIYKVSEANKYKGYVGICDGRWSGCTEFIDVNPNFVANGGFEFIKEGALIPWTANAPELVGTYRVMTNGAREGNKALQLIKRTNKDSSGQIYDFSQVIPRLEKGKTYKLSFYYKVPEEARGRGDNCPLPGASFEFNSLDGYCAVPDYKTKEECELNNKTWTSAPKPPRIEYTAEKEWKKVQYLYTVPVGICSNTKYKDKASCETVPINTWQEFHLLQDFELILNAPLNQNCPDSYILYDQVEIKDNTEDSYFVIDEGRNLDRSTCTAVNWDAGCIQFLNTDKDTFEIIKVKNDRNCEEWAICTGHCSDPNYKTKADCQSSERCSNTDYINKVDCEAYGGTWGKFNSWNDNLCSATDLCTKEEAGSCVKFAAKKDNVRYDLDNAPLEIKRINDFEKQKGYIYRFGSGGLSRLTQWRAGDYSGYSIPDRLPLEKEIELNQASQFKMYPQLNNLTEVFDKRYTEPICKIFPAADAPLPFALSEEKGYENLKILYSRSVGLPAIGNGCFYERAESSGFTTYFPYGATRTAENPTGVDKICTSPLEQQGGACPFPYTCETTISGFTTTACNTIEKTTEFTGLEGMCLEFDTLNPLYSKIYQNFYGDLYNYQPYACLTFYPFMIDLCLLHDQAGCELNPNCSWDGKCNPKI